MRTARRPPVLLSADDAAAFAERLRTSGSRVVFTNGVFDLLHPGHVRYLKDARALGGGLIVAVNSDRSVKAIKGSARPINPEQERAEVLLGLSSVDCVVLFDEDTPDAIIRRVRPDVLVKGADWQPDRIVGREVVEAGGGSVVRVELSPGYSTTDLVNKARRLRQ